MPKLDVDHREFKRESDRLGDLITNIGDMQPRYQKLIAEVVMLRLFGLLEATLKSITVKVLCGAEYLDGSKATLKLQSRNSTAAVANMQSYGRPSPHNSLKWTIAREIKKNVKFLVSTGNNIVSVVDANGPLISEMPRVRNRIAHNNAKSRKEFRFVVRQHYGAELNSVTPGILASQRSSFTGFDPPVHHEVTGSGKGYGEELLATAMKAIPASNRQETSSLKTWDSKQSHWDGITIHLREESR